MTLPIIEEPLYGLIQLETATWSSPFTWVDRTADLAGGFNYNEGGRVAPPGTSQVDVGTLNATFSNAATIPVVGDLVRLRRYGTTEYAFTGYVQDVSQRIVFDQSVSLTTPITLTTINCLDWVGYISQFQAVGVGGANFTTGVSQSTSEYQYYNRIAALNLILDATYATKIIDSPTTTGLYIIGDTDMVGTFSEHLDLMSNSTSLLWRGEHAIPTNKTTGRTSLIRFAPTLTGSTTFTDVAGSPGELHYTEIDFTNSTQNLVNTIIVNNRVRFNVVPAEITKIGGFNQENYLVINEINTVGVPVDGTQKSTDATSITTYGIRQATVETNLSHPSFPPVTRANFICNPSVEYSDEGYSSGSATVINRRRETLKEASPFAAYNGLFAMRTRIKAAAATPVINYSGGESDGTPVFAASTYYFTAKVARGGTSATNARARTRIQWFDADENIIGASVFGSYVSLTTTNTWSTVTSGGVVAPANTVRVNVGIEYSRSSGANFVVGESYFADAFQLDKSNDAYFDGDTTWTATNAYFWTGAVGLSPSIRALNTVDDIGTSLLTDKSTTSMRVTRIRWNAQEDLSVVSTLIVGQRIYVTYNGTTTTHQIVGIDGNIDSERYMIDYYLRKI